MGLLIGRPFGRIGNTWGRARGVFEQGGVRLYDGVVVRLKDPT